MNCTYPIVNQAAHEQEAFDPMLMCKPEGGFELVFLLIDILRDETILHGRSQGQNGFRQGIQKRIGFSPDHHADYFAGLLQAPGIGVAHKMTVRDDLFDFFPGFPVNIRAVIQYPADRSDGDTGQGSDIFDRVGFH